MVTTSEFWVKTAKNTIRKYIYFFFGRVSNLHS